VDPFLLLDEMGPVVWGPGEALGAPDHPHRGFETVTYVLAGRMRHRDSRGHSGVLGPRDVQWMTAGAGVVHSELPDPEFRQVGGRMHGFQLWVNLPRRDKMIPPRYQEIPASRIPEEETDDGRVRVRVIAGEALGQKAVIETRTPITYLHFTVQPGGSVTQPLAPDHHAFVYAFSGRGIVGGRGRELAVGDGQIAVLSSDGEEVVLRADAGTGPDLEVLLIAGAPLREPIARYGPFVMNTREEIAQAVEDYKSGKMGSIGP
jgi:hypothetical protein